MGAKITQHVPRIKTGTYTGNGAATQAITGIGFQPVAVIIVQGAGTNTGTYKFLKLPGMGLFSAAFETGQNVRLDQIISLNVDGFTVGDGTGFGNQLNVNGDTYAYIAFKD